MEGRPKSLNIGTAESTDEDEGERFFAPFAFLGLREEEEEEEEGPDFDSIEAERADRRDSKLCSSDADAGGKASPG